MSPLEVGARGTDGTRGGAERPERRKRAESEALSGEPRHKSRTKPFAFPARFTVLPKNVAFTGGVGNFESNTANGKLYQILVGSPTIQKRTNFSST